MISTFIFDWDEVIVHSDHFHEYAVSQVITKRNWSFSHDLYLRHFHNSLREGFKSYLLLMGHSLGNLETMIQEKKAFDSEYEHWIKPYEDALWLIENLRDTHILGLATRTRRNLLSIGLKKFGLANTFTTLTTSEDLVIPNKYQVALKKMGINSNLHNVAAIEDSPLGISDARSIGIKCIAITRTHSASHLSEANIIVQDLRDLNTQKL